MSIRIKTKPLLWGMMLLNGSAVLAVGREYVWGFIILATMIVLAYKNEEDAE